MTVPPTGDVGGSVLERVVAVGGGDVPVVPTLWWYLLLVVRDAVAGAGAGAAAAAVELIAGVNDEDGGEDGAGVEVEIDPGGVAGSGHSGDGILLLRIVPVELLRNESVHLLHFCTQRKSFVERECVC